MTSALTVIIIFAIESIRTLFFSILVLFYSISIFVCSFVFVLFIDRFVLINVQWFPCSFHIIFTTHIKTLFLFYKNYLTNFFVKKNSFSREREIRETRGRDCRDCSILKITSRCSKRKFLPSFFRRREKNGRILVCLENENRLFPKS